MILEISDGAQKARFGPITTIEQFQNENFTAIVSFFSESKSRHFYISLHDDAGMLLSVLIRRMVPIEHLFKILVGLGGDLSQHGSDPEPGTDPETEPDLKTEPVPVGKKRIIQTIRDSIKELNSICCNPVAAAMTLESAIGQIKDLYDISEPTLPGKSKWQQRLEEMQAKKKGGKE